MTTLTLSPERMAADVRRFRAAEAARWAAAERALAEAAADESPVEYDALDRIAADAWSLGYELIMNVAPPAELTPAERFVWERNLSLGRSAGMRDRETIAYEHEIAAGWDPEGCDHAGSLIGHEAGEWAAADFASEGH